MVRRQRFSIGSLMAIVSMMAVDFSLLRAPWNTEYFGDWLLTFPLLNLIALGFPRLRRSDPARLFWIGFNGVGMAIVVLILVFKHQGPDTFFQPLTWLVKRGWISENTPVETLIECVCVVVKYSAPQLSIAGLVGWLNSRYRVIIERRPQVSVPIHTVAVIES